LADSTPDQRGDNQGERRDVTTEAGRHVEL
jgi:hypothetical protein